MFEDSFFPFLLLDIFQVLWNEPTKNVQEGRNEKKISWLILFFVFNSLFGLWDFEMLKIEIK